VRIVVDGKPQDLPLQEVVRRAQINSAADGRLDEAKRLLREAKAVRGHEGFDDIDERPRARTTHSSAPTGQERSKSVVERIQVSDSDEGAQAMQKFANMIAQGMQQQAVLGHQTQQMSAAIDRFIQRYPQFANDSDFGAVGFTVLGRVRDELRRGGIPEEQLSRVAANHE
jgi:hypothetical protein